MNSVRNPHIPRMSWRDLQALIGLMEFHYRTAVHYDRKTKPLAALEAALNGALYTTMFAVNVASDVADSTKGLYKRIKVYT